MTKFFTLEQVIEIHDVFLGDHGGLSGIRDKGLLISAVEMAKASMLGKYLHKTMTRLLLIYFISYKTTPLMTATKELGHSQLFYFSKKTE